MNERDWILLERYVAGEVYSPEETDQVRRLMKADRELGDYIALIQAARQRTNRPFHGWDATAAFERALMDRASTSNSSVLAPRDGSALNTTNAENPDCSANTPKTKHDARMMFRLGGGTFNRIVYASVSVAIALVIGLSVGSVRSENQAYSHIAVTNATYQTRNAQRAEVMLVDGTHVLLNVGSRMELQQLSRGNSRTVQLSGGAYFRVSHAEGNPFTVLTAGTTTRVLGTEFSVVSYDAHKTTVAVRNGRVSVNNVVLGAHDVTYAVGDRTPEVRHEENLEPWVGFATGRLVLDGVPLRLAIADLNRWYDVNIRISDPALERYPMNAVLLSGSVSELLEILRVTFDAKVVRDARTITIYPR